MLITPQKIEVTIKDLKEMKNFAKMILKNICEKGHFVIFFLYGSVGAGKTQLIKFILEELVQDSEKITSPTFNLLNIYKGRQGEEYFHFDLYRKETINMKFLKELGMDSLFTNLKNLCFIEWANNLERVEDLGGVHIHISPQIEGKESLRKIEMEIKYA